MEGRINGIQSRFETKPKLTNRPKRSCNVTTGPKLSRCEVPTLWSQVQRQCRTKTYKILRRADEEEHDEKEKMMLGTFYNNTILL